VAIKWQSSGVAHFHWANLKRLGVIGTAEPFKEFNMVMDNCGGQNKNRMVLRMLFFLVKLKVATVERIIFLVQGHTKNDCDRLFNLMKKEYRKINTYTPEDLATSIQHEIIDTIMVDGNTFRNWDKLEDPIIDRPSGIATHHCFVVSADRDNGNTIYMKTHHTSNREVARQLVKPIARGDAFWLTV
jgi:hypothetical protein